LLECLPYFVNLSSQLCSLCLSMTLIILVSIFWMHAAAFFFQSVRWYHSGFDNHHNVAKQTNNCCVHYRQSDGFRLATRCWEGDRVITTITLCMASLWSKGKQDMLWKITLLQNLKSQDHEVGVFAAYDGHLGHNIIYNNISSTRMRYKSVLWMVIRSCFVKYPNHILTHDCKELLSQWVAMISDQHSKSMCLVAVIHAGITLLCLQFKHTLAQSTCNNACSKMGLL
jgi:hypothetical protein